MLRALSLVFLLSGLNANAQRVYELESITVQRDYRYPLEGTDSGVRNYSTNERNFPVRWDQTGTLGNDKYAVRGSGIVSLTELPEKITEGSTAWFGAYARGDCSYEGRTGQVSHLVALDGAFGSTIFDKMFDAGGGGTGEVRARREIYTPQPTGDRIEMGVTGHIRCNGMGASVYIRIVYHNYLPDKLRARVYCESSPLILPGFSPVLGEQCWVLISGWRRDTANLVQVIAREAIDSYGNHGTLRTAVNPGNKGIQVINPSAVTGVAPENLSNFKCPGIPPGLPCYPWSLKVLACIRRAVPDPATPPAEGGFGTNCYGNEAPPGPFRVPLRVKQGDDYVDVFLEGFVKPDPNGTFTGRLISVFSQKCLDVVGGDAKGQSNGARAHQWECLAVRSQLWEFLRDVDGTFRLRANHSGRCLDTLNQGTTNGTPVLQWDCDGRASQKWVFVPESDGSFVIQPKGSRTCVEIPGPSVENGVLAQLADCNAGANQRWRIDLAITPRGGTTQKRTLRSYWSTARRDNFLTATEEGKRAAEVSGYKEVRVEGEVFAEQQPGTIPLKSFWSERRRENFTTASEKGFKDARDAGYVEIRTEGYIYATQQPGTVPLKLWWSGGRGDNFTTATKEGTDDAKSWGYVETRVEGWVFPAGAASAKATTEVPPFLNPGGGQQKPTTEIPPILTTPRQKPTTELPPILAPPGNGRPQPTPQPPPQPAPAPPPRTVPESLPSGNIGGDWRYRITCNGTESEGVMKLTLGTNGTYGGKGNGPWAPGTVSISNGNAQGDAVKLRFLPDDWAEPYLFSGRLTKGQEGERVDGQATRSSGSCVFFMDRNAGPAQGFDISGVWRFGTNCGPRPPGGAITFTKGSDGKYAGSFTGPWENVPTGDVWEGIVYGYEVKFNFRPSGWNEHYFWKGRYSGGRLEGQIIFRNQASCNFAMTR